MRYSVVTIVISLAVILSIPAQASLTSPQPEREQQSPDARTMPTQRDACPAGLKSRVVRELTELLAEAIRHGGNAASWVIARLDGAAARAFRKHAKKIADELDRIAKIPDLTTRIVREKLYYFLHKQLGLSGGTALQIADLVKAVLDAVVL